MSVLPALGFGVAVLPICLTPGVSFTLVTDRALTRGIPAACGVTVGTMAGLVTHALLAAAGLSAIVMRSAEAFTVIKLLGAAYLIGLGAWMLIKALRNADSSAAPGAPGAAPVRFPWRRGGDFAQGYLGNVLNPKAVAVYLTLAPQFLNPNAPLLPQFLLLCVAHVAVAGCWLLAWAIAVRGIRRRIDVARFRRRITGLGGAVMIGLGVRTAVAR